MQPGRRQDERDTMTESRKVAAAAAGRHAERKRLSVGLAFHRGGSHGASTWRVLDRVLEAPWIEVEAISGTSAGVMNAAVFAQCMASSGREAARVVLEDFWSRVSLAARMSPFHRSPMEVKLFITATTVQTGADGFSVA